MMIKKKGNLKADAVPERGMRARVESPALHLIP